jgi:hypothetical protein
MTDGPSYHPRVQRLLDGEISLADLPPELRAEGEAALRTILPRAAPHPAVFSPWFEQRVMAAVRRRPHPGSTGVWGWLGAVREIRLRLRPRLLALGVLGGIALFALIPRPRVSSVADAGSRGSSDSVYVRFVLYAPKVSSVALAGSFNEWDPERTPLAPAGETGVWTVTLALPPGQHTYSFVVNGQQWLPDPAAPAVEDGFGHRNSVMTVTATGGHTS